MVLRCHLVQDMLEILHVLDVQVMKCQLPEMTHLVLHQFIGGYGLRCDEELCRTQSKEIYTYVISQVYSICSTQYTVYTTHGIYSTQYMYTYGLYGMQYVHAYT